MKILELLSHNNLCGYEMATLLMHEYIGRSLSKIISGNFLLDRICLSDIL